MSILDTTLKQIRLLNEAAMKQAKERQNTLTKPRGSLGRLEDLSIQLAGIVGSSRPTIKDKVIITMAGDHGVCAEGVNPYPQEITAQMVLNFLRGGAGINVLARHIGARVVIVDMGVATDYANAEGIIFRPVAKGTNNIAKGPAMTKEQALKAVETGIEVVQQQKKFGMDIVGVGEMGIGNTTPSSAIVAAITGVPVANVTGRGTGCDDERLARKIAVIERALEVNRPDTTDPLDVLAKVGGFEIGGMAGVMLGAAAIGIPVVIDGFISGAAALIAYGLCPRVRDYMIAAHNSVEGGHMYAMTYMGLSPLLDLSLRLGEGTGAALGISLAEAAVKILNEMATFGEAGVSEA